MRPVERSHQRGQPNASDAAMSFHELAKYLHQADDARAHARHSKRYGKLWQDIALAYEKIAFEVATSPSEPRPSNVIEFPRARVRRPPQ
jgi:hypothetical protein